MKKFPWVLVFKIAFVLGFFAYLASKDLMSLDVLGTAFQHPYILLLSAFLLCTTTFLGTFRWHLLLQGQGLPLPWSVSWRLAMIGQFFSVALPGPVGGDVVRVVYIARAMKKDRTRAVTSILFDRFAGVSALIMVCVSAAVLGPEFFSGGGEFHFNAHLVRIIRLVGVGTAIVYFILFALPARLDPVLNILHKISHRVPKLSAIHKLYVDLKKYRAAPRAVIVSLLLSIAIHVLTVVNFINLTRAAEIHGLSSAALFMIVPIGLLATAIPMLPAGMGTGHAAFLALFAMIGSQRGADIFNLSLIFQLLIGAAGGLVYLRFKSDNRGLMEDALRTATDEVERELQAET
jgi:uncharacterized protein (TIRG00374 family)